MYKTENVRLLFVLYAWPQFLAVLDLIWLVASLYPLDGHRGSASSAGAHGLALHAPGKLELVADKHNRLSTIGARMER